MKEDTNSLIQYFGTLLEKKQKKESTYQDIIEYVRPNKISVYESIAETYSEADRSEIYDTTAIRFEHRLRSVLSSLLTPYDSMWFSIETDIDVINQFDAARKWFAAISKILFRSYQNSNFYSQIDKFYQDLLTFGIAILQIEESLEKGKQLSFETRDILECCIAENSEGKPDTLFRKTRMTARQIVQEFGLDKVSEAVAKAYEERPEDTFPILHCVFPRDVSKSTRRKLISKKNKPIASIWVEYDTQTELRNSGYNSFPYIITRWNKETNEIYGTSPTIDCMPNIKSLNVMKYTLLKAAQYAADPMIAVSEDYVSNLEEKGPGSIVYVRDNVTDRIMAIDLSTRQFPISLEVVKNEELTIVDHYFGNQIQLPNEREMTATEVRTRDLQSSRILGPTFGLLNTDFLALLLERTLDVLSRIPNILPTPPDELLGKQYRFKFVSPLVKSQRLHEGESMKYIVQTAIETSQVAQPILDNIDFDYYVREMVDIESVDPQLLVPEEQVMAIRKQREMERQAQMQVEMAAKMAAAEASKAQATVNNSAAVQNIQEGV